MGETFVTDLSVHGGGRWAISTSATQTLKPMPKHVNVNLIYGTHFVVLLIKGAPIILMLCFHCHW